MLKVMGLASESPSAEDVAEMCSIIFTKESQKKLSKLGLKFKDYYVVVMTAIQVASGNDENEDVGE